MLTAYLVSVIVVGFIMVCCGYAYHKAGNKITLREYAIAIFATLLPVLNIAWLTIAMYLAASQTPKKE
jgi:ABC-type Co2+ transport system permease subunit